MTNIHPKTTLKQRCVPAGIRIENLTFFSELEVDRQDKITKNIHYLPSVLFGDGNVSHIWVLTSKTRSLMFIDSSPE